MAPGNPNYPNRLLTTTFENFLQRMVVDQIFNDLALFDSLINNSKVKRKDAGGTKLLIPVMYGKSSAVGSYRDYDVLDVTPQEGFTNAEFEWQQYFGTLTLSGREVEINMGTPKMIDLVKNAWMQLEMSFKDLINVDAFNDGTDNNGKALTGLKLMVDSTGRYGNIPRDTETWWAAQETALGGNLTIQAMRHMYNDCSLGKSRMTPDLIITTQDIYEFYESLIEDKIRYNVGGVADGVFQRDALKFRNSTMTWDEECPAGVMYFLNTKTIDFNVQKGRDIGISREGFQTPHNQDAMIAKTLSMFELTCAAPRHNGKLTGVTT